MNTIQISVVISLLNEQDSLKELMDWIHKVMTEHNFSYEVIFVDDGSTDNSWQIITELSQQYEQVKAIKFRRNYGKSAGLYKGFEKAQGDVVITMDADLQDSPDEIPELYRMITEEGYDLVSGWKKKRHDPVLTKNLPSKLYNATVRLMSVMFMSRFGKSPMHFFGTIGMLNFLIGFVILVYLSYMKLVELQYNMTQRPLFYLGIVCLILGTQLFLTGFLAELISRSSSNRNDYLIDENIK